MSGASFRPRPWWATLAFLLFVVSLAAVGDRRAIAGRPPAAERADRWQPGRIGFRQNAPLRGSVEDSAITAGALRAHVERLASAEFEGRSGRGGARAALYIADRFYELGLEPLFPSGFFQEIPAVLARRAKTAAIEVAGHGTDRVLGRNVGAWIPGSDPELRHQCVILSAHYDHLGVHNGVLYPGADDNASGVAMLLEVARAFAQPGCRPRCSVLFVAFDLEEVGLWGSRWFARHSPWPLEEVRGFFTADMLGRSPGNLPGDYVFVMGSEHAPALRDVIAASHSEADPTVGLLGIDLIGTRSDYAPFRDRRVPFLFFSTGEHPDYHQPTDTPERVDYAKLARISRLIFRITERLARIEEAPVWQDEPLVDVEEVRLVHEILGKLLKREGPLALSGARRSLVSSAHATMGDILQRGTITRAERRWLAWVCTIVLLTVL